MTPDDHYEGILRNLDRLEKLCDEIQKWAENRPETEIVRGDAEND